MSIEAVRRVGDPERLMSVQEKGIIDARENAILFGPFRLLPTQRLLLESDKPVRLGSRALDLLIALVERPGELIGKNELMARVWSNVTVVETNLKVQVTALRRALRDGRDGNRYLLNTPGRGYSFVAPVTFRADRQRSAPATATRREHNLPRALTRLIGRSDDLDKLEKQLEHRRLLTIAGPGGIGKTSVALALAERSIDAYEHGAWLIDLAPVSDSGLVPNAVADALGLEVSSENPLPDLIVAIRDRQMLLVIDNCEHVIGSGGALVAEIMRHAPCVHILATSRVPLRVEDERLYWLPPLASPPPSGSLAAADALVFPAVQLFVERVVANSGEFELTDANAPGVADICRKMDGLPLAIGFAAARVAVFGVRGSLAGLDAHMRRLKGGPRGASPRHQSMSATFDWSYSLLDRVEQMVLRRLAIFTDDFTLNAASKVAADAAHSESEIITKVVDLVEKSLLTVDLSNTEPRFRLLETTRAFARIKLAESGERDTINRAHEILRGNPANDRLCRRADAMPFLAAVSNLYDPARAHRRAA